MQNSSNRDGDFVLGPPEGGITGVPFHPSGGFSMFSILPTRPHAPRGNGSADAPRPAKPSDNNICLSRSLAAVPRDCPSPIIGRGRAYADQGRRRGQHPRASQRTLHGCPLGLASAPGNCASRPRVLKSSQPGEFSYGFPVPPAASVPPTAPADSLAAMSASASRWAWASSGLACSS